MPLQWLGNWLHWNAYFPCGPSISLFPKSPQLKFSLDLGLTNYWLPKQNHCYKHSSLLGSIFTNCMHCINHVQFATVFISFLLIHCQCASRRCYIKRILILSFMQPCQSYFIPCLIKVFIRRTGEKEDANKLNKLTIFQKLCVTQ